MKMLVINYFYYCYYYCYIYRYFYYYFYLLFVIVTFGYCCHCHFSKSSKMAKGSIFAMEMTCYGKLSEVQAKLDNIVNNI